MGVVNGVKRMVQFTAVGAVLAYVGFYALTKWDTSDDREATVVVTLGSLNGRRAHATLHVLINGAQRSPGVVSETKTEFSETFWVRPGETVRLMAGVVFGKGALVCQILMDGVPAAPPQMTESDFDAACDMSAKA